MYIASVGFVKWKLMVKSNCADASVWGEVVDIICQKQGRMFHQISDETLF